MIDSNKKYIRSASKNDALENSILFSTRNNSSSLVSNYILSIVYYISISNYNYSDCLLLCIYLFFNYSYEF